MAKKKKYTTKTEYELKHRMVFHYSNPGTKELFAKIAKENHTTPQEVIRNLVANYLQNK
jgi:hypothetical protein